MLWLQQSTTSRFILFIIKLNIILKYRDTWEIVKLLISSSDNAAAMEVMLAVLSKLCTRPSNTMLDSSVAVSPMTRIQRIGTRRPTSQAPPAKT